MRLPQTGGCQCGALRYEVTQAPQLVYTCHCTDCQRITSSAFSMALVPLLWGAYRPCVHTVFKWPDRVQLMRE